MTASLMYLAMNPNITAAEFKQIAEEAIERQARMFDAIAANCAALPLEDRIEYLNHVLPLVLAW